jgi:hypothetical protein
MSLLSRINVLRSQHGNISINRLEKECGLTRGSMAKWDDHAPSADKIIKVANYFGISPGELMGAPAISPEGVKKAPTETSERESISPAKRALLDVIDGLSDEQCEKLLIVVEGAKKLL